MSDRDGGANPGGFVALDRAVAVIEAVRQAQSASLAEVARSTGLSEPTTSRYLTALRRHHVVTRDAKDGTYHLGVRLHDWGTSAPARIDVRTVAEVPLARLSNLLGETIELAAVEGRQLVVLAAHPGSHAVSKVARVGEVERWHSTSVGKAILAESDEDFVAEMLQGMTLSRLTPRTLTTEQLLKADLEDTRRRAYAIDDEESELGLRCVGVALRDRMGDYRFAISASGPSYRMTPDREAAVAESIRATAHEIELAIGFTSPQDAPTGLAIGEEGT